RRGDCGGEGGRGGERTGEHPALEEGADGTEGSKREGEPRGEDRGNHSHTHERKLAAQVTEERVPGCESDGVYKQGEAEGLHELHALPQSGVGGAECQPDEQGPGGTELQWPERDGAHGSSERHREEHGEERVRCEDVEHCSRLLANRGPARAPRRERCKAGRIAF